MNDQEDDKKNLDNTLSDNDNNNQSEVDSNNQPRAKKIKTKITKLSQIIKINL